MSPPPSGKARILGRYALYDEIASGGMASVHLGRLLGPVGFARTVAIKRLHPQFAKDPEFVSMFLDEARLAARIRHPNVVPTLDVVAEDKELFLVMEYVEGESLSRLMRLAKGRDERIPLDMIVAILSGVLQGLHAAHEARGEGGEPLGIVHRDVSPQNVLVGVDGVPRVLDFGIAKAAGRLQTTAEGQLKGKVAYMPPEQIQGAVTRRTDVYSVAVVLWEALVGERLFAGDNPVNTLNNVLTAVIDPPSTRVPSLPKSLDAVAMKGLARDPRERFATAKEMARALEQCARGASTSDLGEWVQSMARDTLSQRAVAVAEIESDSRGSKPSHLIHSSAPPPEPWIDVEPLLQSADLVTKAKVVPRRPDVKVGPEESSLSLARPTSAGSRGNGKTIALVTIIVVLAGALGVVLYRGNGEKSPVPTGVGAATTMEITGQGSGAGSASAATTPSVTALVSASLAPSAIAPTASTTTSSATTTTKGKPKPPRPTVSCNPPYVLDAKGNKRFKEECL